MAKGKIVRLGKYRINFSSRGIATKNDETGVVRKYPFPWVKYQMEKQAAQQQDYEEQGYDPQEQDYDQDYPPQDQENYDLPYDEETGEYYEPEEEYREQGGLMDSDWLMWLLLIVLPPVGIWLLWRRNRFEITARSAISAASTIWCVVLLVWLFSGLGANDDPITKNPANSNSPDVFASNSAAPSESPQVTDTPVPDETGIPANAGTTAIPDSALNNLTNNTATSMPTTVWATPTGQFYHKNSTCTDMKNAVAVSISVCLNRQQTACPVCWPEDTSAEVTPSPTPATITNADGTVETAYYDTPTGKHYHVLPNCTGMTSSQKVTLATALSRNQTPCPTCIGSVYWTDGGQNYHTISNCKGMKNAKLGTIAQAEAAGKTACTICSAGTAGDASDGTEYFYCTENGKNYHSKSDCNGMKGATRITAEAAEAKGKSACPDCIGVSGATSYFATPTGKHFHTVSDCTGMKNAVRVSLATALGRGQTACPTCMAGSSTVTVTGTGTVATVSGGSVTFYSTADGTYFHTRQDCTGMKNATVVDAKEIAARGQTACPKCIGTAGTYYSTTDGTYYHNKATCTGMKNATIVTLAQIQARGQTACPTCLGGTPKTETTTTDTGTGDYWHTADGKYYHVSSTCTGMKNAVRTTARAAEKLGQEACPNCIGEYWHTATGNWYHTKPNCTGMSGATRTTAAAAKKLGQSACPECAGGKTSAPAQATATPAPETGDYWHTENGKNYHLTATCNGMKGATRTTAKAAENLGQSPCPDCIGIYWHTETGTYYHAYDDCDGMKGATRTTAKAAKKLGQTACPECIGGGSDGTGSNNNGDDKKDDEDTVQTVDPDTTNVWVTIEGSYYHTKKSCGGMKNAAQTTLTWALEHNYRRCTDCNAPKAS